MYSSQLAIIISNVTESAAGKCFPTTSKTHIHHHPILTILSHSHQFSKARCSIVEVLPVKAFNHPVFLTVSRIDNFS